MIQTLMVAMAMLVFAACGSIKPQESNQSSTHKKIETMQKEEKQKIEALLGVYKEALNTSNPQLAQSLYTKDGIFMPAGAPSAIGWENILQSYTFIFSQIQLTIEFHIEEIEVENDFAYAVTSSEGTTLIRAIGQTVPEANRELFVFQKVEGEWKIARYMFNKTEPAQ